MADKFYGTGRRKSSVARVYVMPGTGKITINKRDIDDFFGLETQKIIVRQPLAVTDTLGKYDVIVMGTLGRTGMKKILVGSVAEKVVKLSECPVIVVRNSE